MFRPWTFTKAGGGKGDRQHTQKFKVYAALGVGEQWYQYINISITLTNSEKGIDNAKSLILNNGYFKLSFLIEFQYLIILIVDFLFVVAAIWKSRNTQVPYALHDPPDWI